jgi:hypothetical protein
MNPKIVTLLHEGFSMKTLEKMSKQQITVLYEKVKSKEMKEQPAPKVTNKTVKQIELPVGSKTTVSGDYSVANDAGKTVLTQTEGEMTEKAVSKQQQKTMGLALSVKRGETPKSKVSKSVKDMANKMSEKDLEDFASTKHKGLPKKINSDKKTPESKKEVKKLEENILRLIEDHLPPHTTKGELLSAIKKRNR